jgi:putative membrane protein insertion efficiency factor
MTPHAVAPQLREEDRLNSSSPGIAARIALLALRFYKTYLSILFAGSCRFTPTCSQFACEAIEHFGVARGVWLGLKRLLRCHPLSRKFGYDPVPEKWGEASPSAEEKDTAPVAANSTAIPHEVHS